MMNWEIILWVLRFVVMGLGFLGLAGRFNSWYYERVKLGEKRFSLPPGDLGWPFVGHMWSFLRAFKSDDPNSFISSYVSRYGRTGIYKTFMFGSPSVIVTSPDACRKVLTDDEAFKPGWPLATWELMGRKSFVGIIDEEHKRLRKLTMAPVNGHEALSCYIPYIEEIVVSSLEQWSSMGEIEFLTVLRKLTFRVIMKIFLGIESEEVMDSLEKEYTSLNGGIRAFAINLPGFAFYNALKARKKLVAYMQLVLDGRRERRRRSDGGSNGKKRDMMDILMDVKDENGKQLDDEEIIDILLMYLNAGHESSGHVTTWATLFLQKHPHVFKAAKEEQEEILRNRPTDQKGLTLKETRKMEYLSMVIDEALRVVTFSQMVFREARKDFKVNGYTIPKGWKVLVWFRNVHYEEEIWPQPEKFDPSRWIGLTPKAGEFLPFGLGSRLCPGNDLAKLEISIFLHHFLLNYELVRKDPNCPVVYLPHTKPKDNCLGRIIKTTSVSSSAPIS